MHTKGPYMCLLEKIRHVIYGDDRSFSALLLMVSHHPRVEKVNFRPFSCNVQYYCSMNKIAVIDNWVHLMKHCRCKYDQVKYIHF